MAQKPEQESSPSPLADFLKSLRAARGYTLREVEQGTEISNAYLSQLENRKITKPSPHILHTLAVFYGVPYELLMEKAGYIKKQRDGEKQKGKSGRLPLSSLGNVSLEEEKELLRFLAFIRSERRKKN